VVGDDITLDDLTEDPHPHLARLRAASPVAWVPALGGWLVTSHAAAVEVLRDPARFTVDDPRFSTARVVGPSMLSTDGTAHTRHRDRYVAAFRPRAVRESHGAFVSAEAIRLVDALGPTAELRTELAGPLAAATVAACLGLDGHDGTTVARLLGWYREIVASVSGIAAGAAATTEGAVAMAELGQAVRAHTSPGALSDEEQVSNAAVIMFGGIETTEGMILNLVRHVLTDDVATAQITADPTLATTAVEESLRLEPAAAVVDRYATGDTVLAGASIARSDLVVVSLAGAGRDPVEFADPDQFDLRRPNARRHLAFAAGPHVCIGMDLARLEAATALATLLARRPGVRLDPTAPAPRGLVFRKPSSLPVIA
jgi:cytochrome P450